MKNYKVVFTYNGEDAYKRCVINLQAMSLNGAISKAADIFFKKHKGKSIISNFVLQ